MNQSLGTLWFWARKAAIGGITLAAMAGSVQAQELPSRSIVRFAFAPVGVALDQSVRVSVASLIPPPVPETPPTERVRIVLLDAGGRVIADSGARLIGPGTMQ